MAKITAVKRSGNKEYPRSMAKSSLLLTKAEAKLEKKKKELIRIKARHKKLAGEFIDLWVKVRRIKRKLKLI